jgi:hypothetical protein
MYRTAHFFFIGCLALGLGNRAAAQVTLDGLAPDAPAMEYHSGTASDPGKVPLSLERLFRLEPKLAPVTAAAAPQRTDFQARRDAARVEAKRARFIETLKEHLESGDSRAAVVFSVKPLVVAAYSDDLDCVVMLRFPESLVAEHNLKPGSRLLTVNKYPTDRASDVRRGPKQTQNYENVYPVIADFITDDQERVRTRKAAIAEAEWQRCSALAKQYHEQFPAKSRDGSPLRSMCPATAIDTGFFFF